MAGFIQNIIWNSVEGFVEAGTRTAGEYAGNALIKAGDMIENGGRGVGNSIEKKATGYGTAITGQAYKPSPKPLPSSARKPALKRSNSLPTNTKPSTNTSTYKKPAGGSGVPLGGKKYPGANQVNGAVKKVGGVDGNIGGGANKAIGGISNTATRSLGGSGNGSGSTTRSIPPFKGPSGPVSKTQNLPKPYPNTNNLPKPYGGNAFGQNSDIKPRTAVRPGGPAKPFTPPTEQKRASSTGGFGGNASVNGGGGGAEKKAYPGTNTYPGQGKRVPVQKQKMKALPRLGAQVSEGQKMVHLAI